jgi:hypothetical protein
LDSTQDDIPRPLPPNSHFEPTGEYRFLLVFPAKAPLLDIYGTARAYKSNRECNQAYAAA